MKKSQLRKIIRESIKQLLTEQSYPGDNCITIAQTPILQPWNTQYCGGHCDWQFADMCCQNTNNQPYTAPSNGLVLYLGIPAGQTIPCVTSCSPSWVAGMYEITAAELIAVATQYGTTPIINPLSPYPTIPSGGSWYGIWDSTQADNQACNSFMSSPPPPPPPPTPLVAGCTVSGSSNYDPNADGCEVNGVIDPNDVTCCNPIQPGGGTTPINIGQQSADNFNLQVADPITPTPNPSDPQMKRMKDLAFRGKIKK